MSIWKINGQDFDDLVDENLVIAPASQDIDRITFDLKKYSLTDEPPFAYGTRAVITRNELPWFSGVFLDPAAEGAGSSEFQTAEIGGAWWWLTQIDFRTQWAGVGYPYPRAILGQNSLGDRITCGQQIAEILTYALSRIPGDPPFQFGALPNGPDPLWKPVVSVMCSEAIKEMLRYMPDYVHFFDYNTTPPMFKIVARADCKPVDFGLDSGIRDSLQIKTRNDLLVPSVKIIFEEKSVIDGNVSTVPIVDLWPPGATGNEVGCLCLLLTLSGTNETFEKEQVKVQTIPVDEGADGLMAFWKSNYASLAKINVENLSWWAGTYNVSVDEGQFDFKGNAIAYDLDAVPSQLLKGSIKKWMTDADANLKAAKATANITLYYDGDPTQSDYLEAVKRFGGVGAAFGIDLSLPFTATNATTQEYNEPTGFAAPEPVPEGMAEALYNSLSVLQYEGSFKIIQQEVSGIIGLGNVLNLTGGRASWSTMNALVQTIRHTVRTGETVVTFGPPRHLGPQDLLDLFRAARQAKTTSLTYQRTDENNTDSGSLTLDHTSLPPGPGGGSNTPTKPPLPWAPVDNGDGTVTVNQKSFLYDLGGVTALTINNLSSSFEVAIGDILYASIPLTAAAVLDTSIPIQLLLKSDGEDDLADYPVRINSSDPANPYQDRLYVKILQFVAAADDRDAELFMLIDSSPVKVIQLCKTHLILMGLNIFNQSIFGIAALAYNSPGTTT